MARYARIQHVYLYIIGEMSTYKLRNGIFSKFPVFKKKSEEIREDNRDEKSIYIFAYQGLTLGTQSWGGNEVDL